MNKTGKLVFKGELRIKKIPLPKAPINWRIKNALRLAFIKGWLAVHFIVPLAKMFGIFYAYGTLRVKHFKANGVIIDYGIVGYRLVTTAFGVFVVDQLQTETSVFGDFKYHDSGTGTTAENVSDTDIETSDGEARVIGTQTEFATTTYQSVGQITYSGSMTISEHGIFNALTGPTLLDRTVFAGVPVSTGEKIEFDYRLNVSGS